jgi:hypothetical protein
MRGGKVMQRPCALFAVPILLIATVFAAAPGLAQSGGVPSFGFRSYSNSGSRNYNAGIGGYPTNNSFNSGLGGLSQTSNGVNNTQRGPQYNTQRSTQAAENLAREVTSIWSKTPVGRALDNPQTSMAQYQQSSGTAPTANGLLPPISKKKMLRIFLEGGSPQSAGSSAPAPSGANSSATSTAYNNYQTAENEASKAYNAAQRVRNYDTSTWSRKNDASQAEYAANNANYAAQRAESAAYSGDSQAHGYASRARQAANRARSNANQARYNADTMR